jgi:nucleotide-binding universal stress UspA family protein
MAFCTIMTHVQPEGDAAPRLARAVELARRFKARLIGVGAEMIPPLAFDNGYYSASADWLIAMRQSVEAELTAAQDAFALATADFAPGEAVWLSGIESPTPAVSDAARAADLILVGGAKRGHESSYIDVSPAELAMQAGRPVLVAPPAAPPLAARRIVLAWKDTREARRALSDAMPLLEAAEAVLVLELCEGVAECDAKARTEDVAAAIRRHGGQAEASAPVHRRGPVSVQLLDEVRAFGADLLVMGCYGHSRLGEWVFGGMTRDVLAQDEVYVLLSH